MNFLYKQIVLSERNSENNRIHRIRWIQNA
jgi:hypothetical protein